MLDKAHPNAFLDTGLADQLDACGADRLVVVGMMTNMCIGATVREAIDRDIDTVLVADGCAASPLEWGGTEVDGRTVRTAFVAAPADAGTTVVTADALEL